MWPNQQDNIRRMDKGRCKRRLWISKMFGSPNMNCLFVCSLSRSFSPHLQEVHLAKLPLSSPISGTQSHHQAPDYIQSQTVPPVSIPISRPLLAGWFLGLPACLMANGSQSNVKIQYGYVKISGNLLCLPFSWRQWTIMLKTVLQWEVEKLVCIKQIIAFRKNGRFYLPDETSNFPTQEILPFLDQWANLFFFVSQKFVLSFWPN